MEGVKLVVNKVLSSHFQVLPLVWPLLTPLLPACLWILFFTPISPVLARLCGTNEGKCGVPPPNAFKQQDVRLVA